MSKRKEGNKPLKKKQRPIDQDKLMDEMIGPKGTPARDEADKSIKNARMEKISAKELFAGKKKDLGYLDVRIYLDPESKEGGYKCDFAGSPAEFARALFSLCNSNPMFGEIVKSVNTEILVKEEVDKLQPIKTKEDVN